MNICDETPECVGFLRRTNGNCVWKNSERTLARENNCDSDYYRRLSSSNKTSIINLIFTLK